MAIDKRVATIYNPDNQNKEQLVDGFVVRLKTFERLFGEIKDAPMTAPEQHILIEGKRGMGKTTLLLRLAIEVENDEELNTWLMPIVFNEEEYSIRRLYKLWERIAELLEDEDEQFLGLFDDMDKQYKTFETDEAYEYAIFQLLIERLRTANKKIILFIDNFGDIFSRFKLQEVQRLREVLQTTTDLRIISASSIVLEEFYDHKHPFFEFFKVHRLRGLNQKETEEILLKLGETYKSETIKDIIKNQRGRVEALRRLTGGVIRTVVLLFEIFNDKASNSAFSDLEAILDRVTPLYKHRMDDLASQQQEIVQAIALAWDAVNTKEISQKTRLESKKVSAQLRTLEKNEIIIKKLTTTKNHLYQVNERFFNIWYLMRHGRKGDRRKVLWLVRFLEEWCDEGQIADRAKAHIEYLKSKRVDDRFAWHMTEAIAQVRQLDSEVQHELLSATRNAFLEKNSEYLTYLSESDKDLFTKILNFHENEEWERALVCLDKMTNANPSHYGQLYINLGKHEKAKEYYIIAAEDGNPKATYNLALLYEIEFNDYQKAEKYYLQAINKGNLSAAYNLAILYQTKFDDKIRAEKFYLKAIDKGHSEAMNNLALLYKNEFNDTVKAEKYYLLAIDNKESRAMNNLAYLYETEHQDNGKAEKYYLMAIKNGNIEAMNNLALLYQNKYQNTEKAKKYFLRATDKNHSEAMNNLALLYKNEFQDYEKAEYYYLMAVKNGYLDANFNLALLYQNNFSDFLKAKTYYLKAIDNGDANAMNNLGVLYETEYKDIKKAEKYYLKAIEKEHSDAMYNLALLYHLGFQDSQKAETYYLKAIEKGNHYAINNLAYFYFKNNTNLKYALEIAQKAAVKTDSFSEKDTLAKIQLINGLLNESLETMSLLWYEEENLTGGKTAIEEYLILLIAKKEYSVVYNYFNSNEAEPLQLKDRFKPHYYALMYFLQDKYPNEYLRMGDELKETVEELITQIEKLREKYA